MNKTDHYGVSHCAGFSDVTAYLVVGSEFMLKPPRHKAQERLTLVRLSLGQSVVRITPAYMIPKAACVNKVGVYLLLFDMTASS